MAREWLGLQGRVCVITGASGGIGAALARAFGSQGCSLLLLDTNVAAAEELALSVREAGGRAMAMSCDTADRNSVLAAERAGEAQFGAADILINNAAIIRPGSLAELSLGDWNALLQVNLTGYFICAQLFGRKMASARRGSIINISSIAGDFPQGFSGAYSVCKAGVQMLSQGLATEWGPMGIRVNVLSPAMVMTPMTAMIYEDPKVAESRIEAVPLRRIGLPEDIADAALFLASDRSSYLTGEELVVDGGFRRNLLGLVRRPGFEPGTSDT